MAKKDPKVAKRYARALFYVVPPDQYEGYQWAIGELERCWRENGELQEALNNPAVSPDTRALIVQELCARLRPGDEQFASFGKLLLRNDRLNVLGEVQQAFVELVRAARGIVAVEVTSAFQLSDEERGALQQRLQEQLQKTVTISWLVDPEILGGLIIRSADKLIDGSLRGTLERLGTSLTA